MWAVQCLEWTFMVGNSRETTDSIAWYSSLVGGDPLPYDILFRLVLFLFTCLESEREADAAAVFTMLRDHVNALDALPYDVAALLAAPALLVLNSHVTILFGSPARRKRTMPSECLRGGSRCSPNSASMQAVASSRRPGISRWQLGCVGSDLRCAGTSSG